MAIIEQLLVRLGLSTEEFRRGTNEARRETNRLEQAIGGLKNALGLLGVGLSAGALVNFGKEAFMAADELDGVEKKLQAVLKATGGAAGISFEGLQEYAEELERLTGIEETSILQGQAVLATFKNVRGAAFQEATRAAIDMSSVVGSLDSAFIQLGKALNDPIKGVSALSEVGVSFNDQQREAIRNFVEMNDLASAQRVILDELAGEFGGTGEAIVSEIDHMRVAWNNLKETVGGGLAELLAGEGGRLTETINALTDAVTFLREGSDAFAILELFDPLKLDKTDTFEKLRRLANPDTTLPAASEEELAEMTKEAADAIESTLDPAAEKLQKKLDDLTHSLQLQLETFGMSSEQAKIHALALEGVADEQLAVAQAIADTLEMRREEVRLAEEAAKAQRESLDEFADGLERNQATADRLFEQTRTDVERLAAAMAEAQSLRDQGLIDDETLGRLQGQMEEEIDRLLAEQVGPVQLAGALEAGSGGAISALSRFQAEGGRGDQAQQQRQQMVQKLELMIQELRQQTELEQQNLVESFT